MPIPATQQSKEEELSQLGIDPSPFLNKRISFHELKETYSISQDEVIAAVKKHLLWPDYHLVTDTIWFAAIDVAHYFHCARKPLIRKPSQRT